MLKYEPKIYGELKNPIFIIGMAPNKQRKNCKTLLAFDGNRSGDFISGILAGVSNVLVTNVINYYGDYDPEGEMLNTGLKELNILIKKYSPSKVICLGTFAAEKVKMFNLKIPIVNFKHPSYILRFKGNKDEYSKTLLKELHV